MTHIKVTNKARTTTTVDPHYSHALSLTMSFKLFCVVVEGDIISPPFSVSIPGTNVVDELKDAIKMKIKRLNIYDNTDLELWRLEPYIPNDNVEGLQLSLSMLNEKGKRMQELSMVKNIFGKKSPPAGHLHLYMKTSKGKWVYRLS